MIISHLAASVAAKAISDFRINPLRVVRDEDIWQQDEPLPIEREDTEKMILEKFEPYFEMLEKFLNVLVKKADEVEEKYGYSEHSRRINSTIGCLALIAPAKAKDANYFLKDALNRLSDDTLNDVFCEVCEDPFLVLDSDLM